MLTAKLRPARWQTGNGLFVYAYCYLLARSLGYAADIEPVEGFPRTFQAVEGDRVEADPILIEDIGYTAFTEPFYDTVQRCRGHKVIVNGHMERSEYYLPFREKLQYALEPSLTLPPSGEVAVHMRGTDVRDRNDIKLSLAYYQQALDLTGRDNAVIYTDDPSWSECQALGLPVKHGTPLQDFAAIMSARAIIIPKSSFAWWAAFLSTNAQMVVQPEPQQSWRSRQTPNAYLHVPFWKQIEVP